MNKILFIILLLTGHAFAQVDTIKIPGTEYDTANEIKTALTRATTSLQGSDTLSLSNRINLKLTATDTSSLSNRINVETTLNSHYNLY